MTSDLLLHPYVQILAWALVHFLWQGALIGLAAFALTRVARTAVARYTIGVAALAAMLAAPAITVVVLSSTYPTTLPSTSSTAQTSGGQRAPMRLASDQAAPTTAILNSTRAPHFNEAGTRATLARSISTSTVVGALLAAWCAGVIFLSLRLFGSWLAVRHLVRHAVRPVSDEIHALARRVAGRLALDRVVRVCESSAVVVPVMIGWLKPVVLLPASTISGLSPVQIEALIAHEFAHVQRHDYLVNLLQAIVETLLFYHPAVWWMSSKVRAEREHCCDDLALRVCDRLVYVTALADLAALNATPRVALAASGGPLLTRVRRILSGAPENRVPGSGAVYVFMALLVAGMLFPAVLVLARGAAPMPLDRTQTFANRGQAVAGNRASTIVMPSPRLGAARALSGRLASPQGRPMTADELRRVEDELAQLEREREARLDRPAPPAPPAPPSPPASAVASVVSRPMAAPAPQAQPAQAATSGTEISGKGSGNFVWNSDGDKLAIKWTGGFRISNDDKDIEWVESGKTVEVTDGGWVLTTGVVLRGLPDGTIERSYRRNGFAQPYEPAGRAYLADALIRVIRHTGFGAESRVARFLKQGGVDAVFAEIAQLESDYVRRIYYTELFKQAKLTPAQVTKVAEQASTTIKSDYELGTLLKVAGKQTNGDDGALIALIDATKTIDSDYEQRQALASLLPQRPSVKVASAVLTAASGVGSDYERATLLIEFVHRGGLSSTTKPAFFDLVTRMSSSYEQGRVLQTVTAASDMPADVVGDARKSSLKMGSDYDRKQVLLSSMAGQTVTPKDAAEVIDAASTIRSDNERANVLIELARKGGVTAESAAGYFAVVSRISSSYEQRRTIDPVLASPKLDDAILTPLLKATATIKSDNDRAETLIAVARRQSISAAVRPLYVAAAEGIRSDYDQTRALAELVRAEKRGVR